MSDDDKMIKLEELPDEGSSSSLRPTPKRKRNQEIEPRIKNLEGRDEASQVEEMSKKWYFGEKLPNYGWIFFSISLALIEFSDSYQDFIKELVLSEYSSILDGLLRHPIFFLITVPYFFNFYRNNKEGFTVTFDGILTVQQILPIGQKGDVISVLIKWDEMTRIEKDFVGEKEVLKIFSIEGHIGDIIWYIDIHKKKAFCKLLKSLIRTTHPLMVFLDNEKELK